MEMKSLSIPTNNSTCEAGVDKTIELLNCLKMSVSRNRYCLSEASLSVSAMYRAFENNLRSSVRGSRLWKRQSYQIRIIYQNKAILHLFIDFTRNIY